MNMVCICRDPLPGECACDMSFVCAETLYLTWFTCSVNFNHVHFFHVDTFNEWMTTPIPLPITPPEDPLSGTNSITNSTPTLHTYTPSHAYTPSSAYTVTPTFSYHASPSPVPLTPESLVSPDSFCNSEEVDEVLSYFSSDSSRSPMASNDAFNVFPSTSSAGTPFPASQIYSDSGECWFLNYDVPPRIVVQ